MIKVVGLGPGSVDAITLGALEALKESNNVYLRTDKHPNIDYLKGNGIYFSVWGSCESRYWSRNMGDGGT